MHFHKDSIIQHEAVVILLVHQRGCLKSVISLILQVLASSKTSIITMLTYGTTTTHSKRVHSMFFVHSFGVHRRIAIGGCFFTSVTIHFFVFMRARVCVVV